ncbi:cupredoxin domain-containing protein, partial [Patescibacteria group bacterium]|nr:cupredoxin domain-containing protein [Patescibacteria group bacterium]
AGILVLFFAFFNINAQLNVLGVNSLNDIKLKEEVVLDDLAPIENEKQILEMSASSAGYKPNYFKIRAGVPVVWKIKDDGTSGCTNAVIARDLFFGEIRLTRGETSVKEFTAQKPGKYKFSCWMGMVSGTIEVVE